jgi:hypothetical protein
MGVNPQAARSLAYWLRATAPALYVGVLRLAAQQSKLGECCACTQRLGQDTLDTFTPSLTSADYITDPSVIPEITITGSTPADPFVFTTVDPATFTPITVDQSALTVPDVTAPIDSPAGSTPPAAPSGPSALAAVGNYLTTGGGLNALLNLGTQVLKTQAAHSNAVAAQSILTAQVSRVMSGAAPAAISYTVNPVTGQVMPVLNTPSGPFSVTPPLLNALAPNAATLQVTSFLSQYGLYIGAGVLLLLLIKR